MSQKDYLPQKRDVSQQYDVWSAANMTKEQRGNIMVTTVTCFAAKDNLLRYCEMHAYYLQSAQN